MVVTSCHPTRQCFAGRKRRKCVFDHADQLANEPAMHLRPCVINKPSVKKNTAARRLHPLAPQVCSLVQQPQGLLRHERDELLPSAGLVIGLVCLRATGKSEGQHGCIWSQAMTGILLVDSHPGRALTSSFSCRYLNGWIVCSQTRDYKTCVHDNDCGISVLALDGCHRGMHATRSHLAAFLAGIHEAHLEGAE